MKILRADNHKRMPWKNGRGETVEIAVFPEGATVDTFDWRVSMATVSENGPFSVFPGIDRTLSILEGEGMELLIEERDTVRLTQASAPYAFPADTPTTARLVGGAITDLNVMTRRGRYTHVVERYLGRRSLPANDTARLILCGTGRLRAEGNDGAIMLNAFDGLFLDEEEALEILEADTYYLVTLAPNAPDFV